MQRHCPAHPPSPESMSLPQRELKIFHLRNGLGQHTLAAAAARWELLVTSKELYSLHFVSPLNLERIQ